MYLDGGFANRKNILQKLLQTEKTKPKPNQTKLKKKRYKLYKEIAIDNKISPLWEANLSPTRGLDFFCGFFFSC